jgi:hypothetical protein
MAINILNDPDGFRKSAAGLERVMAEIAGGASPTARLAGLELVRAVKLELSQPGTGRTYKKGRHKHVASAPGEPPAVDTGALRNSIDMETVGGVLRVGSGLKKAPGLEFGTVGDGGHIAPRPFMRPALEKVKDKMTGVVVTDLRRHSQDLGG